MPPPTMASLMLTGVDGLVEMPSGTGRVHGSSGTDATAEMPFGIGDADEVPFKTVAPLVIPLVIPFGTEVPLQCEESVGVELPFGTDGASAIEVPFWTGAPFVSDAASGTETTSWNDATSGADAIRIYDSSYALLEKVQF